jgi:outer membrane protein OmpA-like peptidoglycan-associated protein
MYLQSYPETGLGQAAPRVFRCSVNPSAILDDFLVGDYRLRPSHYEKLMAIREMARLFKNSGKQMSVSLEGFTDNTGKEVMNQGLSVSRAAEVQNFLARIGVGVHSAVGSGEANPRASNATEAGRRKNRRVELRVCVLLPPPPPPPVFTGLGDISEYVPWRARPEMRPKAPQLRFFNLDQFELNESRLTPLLKRHVGRLAEVIRQSWLTMQPPEKRPIAYVRLIGHTDSTGNEGYNKGLGDRRAETVKRELEEILKRDILSGRIRIAILVEPSPGKSSPIADNRTLAGQALNRRVEVFIEPPVVPYEPKPQPDLSITEEIKRRILERDAETKFNRKLPILPAGKTAKQWIDDVLREHHVPKWLRDRIWDATVKEDWGVLSRSLDLAGIRGGVKDFFLQVVRAVLETPAP